MNDDIIISDRKPVRSMGIKNLMPGLVERGKIKIGNKGAMRTSQQGNSFQAPQKLDHFLITSMAKGADNNFLRDDKIHEVLGDKPTEIPVVLLYDDIELNFQTRYACYNGKNLYCSGDGETARYIHTPANKQTNQPAVYAERECTCYRQDPTYQGKDKCKINGNLSVMIAGVDVVGGVWKFRTTSFNSVVGLLSSLALIKRITGGPLAGIPLTLTVQPKTVSDPIQGSTQVVYVVGLEYRGAIEALQQTGYQTLLTRQQHNIRIEHIEDEAKRLISNTPQTFAAPDDIDDEIDEFYPEQRTVTDAASGVIIENNAAGLADIMGDDAGAGVVVSVPKAEKKSKAKPEPKPVIEPEPAPENFDDEVPPLSDDDIPYATGIDLF